jgi:hypothetical protein
MPAHLPVLIIYASQLLVLEIKSYSCWTSAETELNDARKALWPLASLKGTHLITWYLPGKLETILNLRKVHQQAQKQL